MLDGDRRQALRSMLEAFRHELGIEVAERLADVRTADDGVPSDILERVERFEEKDRDYAVLELKTETIRRIDAALARLEAGEYGTCAECGGDITERRLEALPFATRCRSCESLMEEKRPSPRRKPEPLESA
jgi:DnaK suppressor protein